MKILFPEALPVSRRSEDIRKAIAGHQVVIVCGDTGSGKTTQLPKIAWQVMQAQREASSPAPPRGRIGCTQPRRIAATSVAARVAEETEVSLGREVGYQIRFEDRTSEDTAIKFMTDGVLLAETRQDPDLRQYSTLIIDEAHERSLNIDFILGYLHRLLPRRRDLKVIISSATMDAGSFSSFFGEAPVIQVEGRTFPVEDWYQEPLDDWERLADQVARAIETLGEVDRLGDTLVFLPGEREIRDAADLLDGRRYPDTLVLPLFARQASKDQQLVFQPSRHHRRLILTTNVAETSLTIPGIRFVVDSGLARVSRFDTGSGIQRLQIEAISQASARQRRGRCGRISEGICVKLYSEEDFRDRPEYTDPEIQRSNLAGVVLQMEHLGLGDPLAFPFLDPPQPKRVSQAYRILEEIDAIEKKDRNIRLTSIGRDLARMPLDPRVGRLLIGAHDENCLADGLVLASALSVQDPRERPQEKQQAADQAHARFRDKRSDFTGWLRWWHGIHEARGQSNNHLRRFCQKNFLNYRRVQEWLNLHRELRDTLRQLRWKLPDPKAIQSDPADTFSEPLHRAILAAIPSLIGGKLGPKQGYRGARNTNFFLFPGSGVFPTQPNWVMAFEMVETAKLYARNVAAIDPAWMEKVAPHLCRYRYTNPHWVMEQGAVYAEESVIAFGLTLIQGRRVHYGRINPKVAREIFILEALFHGNTRAPLEALEENRRVFSIAEKLEDKLRRSGGLFHPEAVVAFYEDRLPSTIHTQKQFEKWASGEGRDRLQLSLADCLVAGSEDLDLEDYPDYLLSPDGSEQLELRYLHRPTDPADGITIRVPLRELPHLPEWFGDWLVPGWLPEKVSYLLRCLRKDFRTLLPANRDVVDAFVASWDGYEPQCGLLEALIDFLSETYLDHLTDAAFELERLPDHLIASFEVLNDKGKVLATSKDLASLQQQLAGQVRDRFGALAQGRYFDQKIRDWNFGDLPSSVALDKRTTGYPRLTPGRELPELKLWPNPVASDWQHGLGVVQLYSIVEKDRVKRLREALFSATISSSSATSPAATSKKTMPPTSGGFASLAAAFGQVGSPSTTPVPKASPSPASSARRGGGLLPFHYLAWLDRYGVAPQRHRDDLVTRVLLDTLGSPMTRTQWDEAREKANRTLFEVAEETTRLLARLLETAGRVVELMNQTKPGYGESLSDAKQHLDDLLAPGWLLVGSLQDKWIEFQGLEARLNRMFGAPPVKDWQKLERFYQSAATATAPEERFSGDFAPAWLERERHRYEAKLRLQIFAPEVLARTK